MDTILDRFTIADRRELIEQGLMLKQMQKDLKTLQETVEEDIHSHARRIRSLEDTRLEDKTKLKTLFWVGGITFTVLNTIVSYIIKVFIK